MNEGDLIYIELIDKNKTQSQFLMKVTDSSKSGTAKLICVMKAESYQGKKDNLLSLKGHQWNANIQSEEVDVILHEDNVLEIGGQGIKFNYEPLSIEEKREVSVYLI